MFPKIPKAFSAHEPRLRNYCKLAVAFRPTRSWPTMPKVVTPTSKVIERVAKQLTERGFHSVEFITTRTRVESLENMRRICTIRALW